MKKRIVITILIILILSIGGIWIGKTVYDRSVEDEKASMLLQEQWDEVFRKDNYITILHSYLSVYVKKDYLDKGLKTGIYTPKEVNGLYIQEDRLKIWLHLYQMRLPGNPSLTIEEIYDLYLEENPDVSARLDDLVEYCTGVGKDDRREYIDEIETAYKKYKEENQSPINGKRLPDLTYEDFLALEDWVLEHPDEELYPNILKWQREKEEAESKS